MPVIDSHKIKCKGLNTDRKSALQNPIDAIVLIFDSGRTDVRCPYGNRKDDDIYRCRLSNPPAIESIGIGIGVYDCPYYKK